MHVLHRSLMFVMLQDAVGVGNHAANLIFSTTSAGSLGVLQDWLIIDSTGLANFTGDHNADCYTCDAQNKPVWRELTCVAQTCCLLALISIVIIILITLTVTAAANCNNDCGYGQA